VAAVLVISKAVVGASSMPDMPPTMESCWRIWRCTVLAVRQQTRLTEAHGVDPSVTTDNRSSEHLDTVLLQQMRDSPICTYQTCTG
jgi:hypothetical protein